MAWTPQDEKTYRENVGTLNAGALADEARFIKNSIQTTSMTGEVMEVAVNKLRICLEEIDRRGMSNPLATPNPTAPPAIPGVTMPKVQQRAPQPPPVTTPKAAQPTSGGTVSYMATSKQPVATDGTAPDSVLDSHSSVLPNDRKCSGCSAFISAHATQQQIKKFGKSMAVSMCSRLEIPLDTMNTDTKQFQSLHIDMARSCQEWGRPADVVNLVDDNARLRIAASKVLEPEVIKKIADDPKPKACTACYFYSPPETMVKTLGITQGACTRYGKLIPLGRAGDLASNCEAGREVFSNEYGKQFDWSKTLLHAYRSNITVVSPDTVVDTRAPAIEDPTTYPTDKELTEDDIAHGIRAWQKLMDPEKGSDRFVYMPIFDPESFTPEERAEIPVAGRTAEDDHPELYEDHFGLLYTVVVLWLQLHETPALNGIAGVGKTEFFRYAAFRMCLPFKRFSITNSTELDELQGRMNLVTTETGNRTEFSYGRVSTAWGRRCVLCIDEPNTGPNDVWQFFRPLTDNSKQLVLDVNNGERLDRNPHCYMGMAFNPSWDMRNVGTHEIGDADGSRLMHIAVPMPNKEQEMRIIRRRCELDGYKITKATLEAVMNIAKELRDLASQDAFPVHWGIRNQIKVARATAWFSLERAYRLAAGDLIDPDACDRLMVIVKSHAPSGDKTAATAKKPRVARSARPTR